MTESLHIAHVTLRVSDLARSIDFYVDQVGFAAGAKSDSHVDLATATGAAPILRLVAEPGIKPASHRAAGLYHVALVFPERQALGSWLRRAAKRDVAFDGFSDHAVSEAIYFADPDGNGLEFYADRPREVWSVTNAGIEMGTRPLDLQSLLSVSPEPSDEPLRNASWGHIHLRVRDLDRSERFYCDLLGLQVMQRNYPEARFIAADGYHHHLGLNVWGHPREPQPPDTVGLARVTFARRGANAPTQGEDPDGIRFEIAPLV